MAMIIDALPLICFIVMLPLGVYLANSAVIYSLTHLLEAMGKKSIICLPVCLCCLLSGAAHSFSLKTDGPWQEALVSVSSLDQTAAFFLKVAGYETMHRGEVDRAQLAQWGLGANVTAHALLLKKPDTHAGFIRLIKFSGAEQIPIRATARAWDTGGYFSLMTRGRQIELRLKEALQMGWLAESEPVQFDFGPVRVKNVVLKGPDGVNIAVYERVTPPLTTWPAFNRLSQPFNAMQMVRDMDRAFHFYKDVLGFEVFLKGDYLDAEDAYNNFGIPSNFVTKIPRRYGILYPVPGETGRMEVMQFQGFTGKDFSGRALPPNLGILSIRFPVSDLNQRLQSLSQQGWPITFKPARIRLPPYGDVTLFAVQSPDGAMIEFFQRNPE